MLSEYAPEWFYGEHEDLEQVDWNFINKELWSRLITRYGITPTEASRKYEELAFRGNGAAYAEESANAFVERARHCHHVLTTAIYNKGEHASLLAYSVEKLVRGCFNKLEDARALDEQRIRLIRDRMIMLDEGYLTWPWLLQSVRKAWAMDERLRVEVHAAHVTLAQHGKPQRGGGTQGA